MNLCEYVCEFVDWLVGCVSSKQHASASLGMITQTDRQTDRQGTHLDKI